jgi:CHASE3 domain sensor protein
MKQPETPIIQDHEQDALQQHIRKMTAWASYRRARKLLTEIEQDERVKQRLLKIFSVISFILVGAVVLIMLVTFWASHHLHG